MAVIFSVTCCAGFLTGRLPQEAFIGLASVVVAHYFGRSRDKKQIKANGYDKKHDKEEN